jgi:hypothetical protein
MVTCARRPRRQVNERTCAAFGGTWALPACARADTGAAVADMGCGLPGVAAGFVPEEWSLDWRALQQRSEFWFTLAFTLEMLVKIVSLGFAAHAGAYLRSGWNVLDFLVVLVSWLSIVLCPGPLGASRWPSRFPQ